MELSNCMAIIMLVNKDGKEYGLLVYIGHTGDFYEIIGFKDKHINLRKI